MKKCLVLMPFLPELLEVYEDVYKPVCQQNGVLCWRVDDGYIPGQITRETIKGILEADMLIVDITARNPNVFYELGVSHAISNKCIIVTRIDKEDEKIPFNIQGDRIIKYETSIREVKTFQENLSGAINVMLNRRADELHPVQEIVKRLMPTPSQFEGGLVEVLTTFHKFSHADFLDDSEDLIVIINDGRSWVRSYREKLAERSKTKSNTRIILVHPKSDFITTLTKKNGKTIETQIEELRASVNIVEEIANDGGRISIYGHNLFNPASLFLSEKKAVVMPYYFNEAGNLPVLIFENKGDDSLYESYRKDALKLLEKHAQPLKVSDF